MTSDLTTGSVPKRLFRFALPLLFANVLQFLYQLVDMLVVGRFLGSPGLAAVGSAAMLCYVITSLCSGAATGNYGNNDLAGVPTAVAGFASVFGDKLGSLILAVGLLLFATSTILGWALYGTRCAEFLFGSKIIRPYQVLFCLVVIAGSVANLKLVWDISDTLNGLMAIPNLIGILLLSPVVIKLTKEHFNGVKAGKLE